MNYKILYTYYIKKKKKSSIIYYLNLEHYHLFILNNCLHN